MLKLKSIVKDYTSGGAVVHALKGIDLEFRRNEFVSILGPSGCGKTTLLNILGGLDRYTSGDLIIDGRSTRQFSERDWDTYRNHSIGFVFQSYNLIQHQSVLANVELALTLSGVSKSERRRRAAAALAEVGLADQLSKRPNQLSGGQMQRVAIARALVNDPEILLADEPTGALDSETSIQVMELLARIAKKRLVIMVTHNGELAERYSSRIIRLLDGQITGDTAPYDGGAEPPAVSDKPRVKQTAMSFLTALSLSLNNLMTKKTRTFLTAFAGSIGIIGIALILSLSSGFQDYIDTVQENTLSGYPIMIEKNAVDMASLMTAMSDANQEVTHTDDRVYAKNVFSGMMKTMFGEIHENDLAAFRTYLQEHPDIFEPCLNAVSYGYDIDLNIYRPVGSGYEQISPVTLFEDLGMAGQTQSSSAFSMGMQVWTQMIDNPELLAAQYDVLAGRWPESSHEVILITDDNNEITDYALYALGLKDPAELQEMMRALRTGQNVTLSQKSYAYSDLIGLTYRILPSTAYYEKENGRWIDRRDDEAYLKTLLDDAAELTVVGIVRPAGDAVSAALSGTVGYLSSLTTELLEQANAAEIVREQRADTQTNVFTGLPFADETGVIDPDALTEEQRAYLASLSPEELAALTAGTPAGETESADSNLRKLGACLPEDPDRIYLYAVDFAAKETLTDAIEDYNLKMQAQGLGSRVIRYTDYVGLMMSSVSTIINAISYVLIGFVGISLVVSSIMIGIITYISVLERTKEIGILRSIGARSRDISRVFNAETLIVGFVAGALGILITLLLTIPLNAVIQSLAGISGVASLPVGGAVILILISMALTLIAGLIPARIASKKDPVVALRTE